MCMLMATCEGHLQGLLANNQTGHKRHEGFSSRACSAVRTVFAVMKHSVAAPRLVSDGFAGNRRGIYKSREQPESLVIEFARQLTLAF